MSARHLCEPDHQFAILNGTASSEKLHIFHVPAGHLAPGTAGQLRPRASECDIGRIGPLH